ncbi:hypothetical protein LX64_00846 [Chitinophaga skermanii]|uniref:Uncharacterized protein n=1 Tax=Chitinophaga skermanii TaxID=331697 RepID=A0A327QUB9_9BACT|nr:hypothetical protein LX64_00846 [Chitinophaga skermanii]
MQLGNALSRLQMRSILGGDQKAAFCAAQIVMDCGECPSSCKCDDSWGIEWVCYS